MFAYINGTLDSINEQKVVLDVGGVGFEISVSKTVLANLPSKGERVRLYTYFHIREDTQELYGFLDRKDKELFEKLITVSGIGPKVAMGMLSTFSGNQLATAILTGDTDLLKVAPGIGKKTADRVILELKDKLDIDSITESTDGETLLMHDKAREAVEALMALGYTSQDAERALVGVEGEDTTSLVRLALKNLDSSNR